MLIYCRSGSLDGELYCDHLIDIFLRMAGKEHVTTVELQCLTGQTTLKKVAKSRGFTRQPNSTNLVKIVLGRPVTQTSWASCIQQIRIQTGLWLPTKMPVERDAEAFTIRSNSSSSRNVSLNGLEGLLGPTLLIRPNQRGVIVPINRAYSTMLLGPGRQLSLGLTDDRDAAFRSKRAYVNTPRAAGVMRPDAPILFYESMRSGGTGGIVAVGRIVDSVILDKREISLDQQRRIVVEDIDEILTGNEILLTTFCNLFSLPKQVPLNILRTMGAIDGSNLVSAKGVPGDIVTQVVDYGWQNERCE